MAFDQTTSDGGNMPLFQTGPAITARLVLFVALSVALIILDYRQHLSAHVRQSLGLAVYPVYALADLPYELRDMAAEQLTSRRELLEENARLRTEHLLYEARLQRLDSLERENINLRDLLQSSYKVTESVLIAELLSVDLDPYSHLVEVNKGTRDQVFVGQPVLGAKGIMGQVDDAKPLSATIRLITDPSHAIPVQVNRNGLRAIALGTGDIHRLELSSLPNNADIRVGDLLVSSGLGGRFPPGYPVARVTRVEAGVGQPFAQISAEPTAALDRAREVLLVRTSDRAARRERPSE